MVRKNAEGREIEFTVYGKYEDDIQITDANYLDGDEDVAESDILYLLDTYQDAIYMAWVENMQGYADSLYDLRSGR